MGYIKQNSLLEIKRNIVRWSIIASFSVIVISLILIIFYDKPTMAISEKKYNAISQNCSTIRQSLKTLQKTDSRARSYLGTTYEAIATKFMIPLNVRLVKNGRPNTDLSEIQSDFTYSHSQFKEKYTDYMKELEALINMECQRYPDAFYGQLEKLRESREKLQKTVNSLAKLSTAQLEAVTVLRGSL